MIIRQEEKVLEIDIAWARKRYPEEFARRKNRKHGCKGLEGGAYDYHYEAGCWCSYVRRNDLRLRKLPQLEFYKKVIEFRQAEHDKYLLETQKRLGLIIKLQQTIVDSLQIQADELKAKQLAKNQQEQRGEVIHLAQVVSNA